MKRIHFKTIDSTHQYAKEIALCDDIELTSITADYQTCGKGTNGRNWQASTNSSLLLSMILPAPRDLFYPILSKICAISMIHTLKKLHINATFCYPNDVMIQEKKVCGILSEISKKSLIASLGLNINQSKQELAIIDQPATSLYLQTRVVFDKEEILSLFLPLYLQNMENFLPHYGQHLNSYMNLAF